MYLNFINTLVNIFNTDDENLLNKKTQTTGRDPAAVRQSAIYSEAIRGTPHLLVYFQV